MDIDKAMIIIAVSRYAGAYNDLPGVITSAHRMREWAEQPGDDCNYNVLYIGDDEHDKIDVSLIRGRVRDFVDNNYIDRLVVYFAGHGIVRSAGEQYWLLTDADIDTTEGINVEAFRRGLMKCNIGAHRDNFTGQLCIIGDACRNISKDAIEFYGHPIITSTGRMNRKIQLDRFLSTGLGNYSFQINQIGNQVAYCLFSEVMLIGLYGGADEVIDNTSHTFKPVVTNHKLADYLEDEVKRRAAEIDEEMEPDILTGIRPDYNYYKKMIDSNLAGESDFQSLLSDGGVQVMGSDGEGGMNDEKEVRKSKLITLKRRISDDYYDTFRNNDDYFKVICDFHPKVVAAPGNEEVIVERIGDFFSLRIVEGNYEPVLIQQDDQWILIPIYPNVVSVISDSLPGDILFLKTGEGIDRDEIWDNYLSDFSNLAGNIPLRAADARKFADNIRIGKEEYPHQSVTAGYLYEFSNDYSNIARTAHYMARNTGSVPFDLALLCADRIYWRSRKGNINSWSDNNDYLIAFADIPAVEDSPNDVNRPYYARRRFSEERDVKLLGIAPIFSQGWSFMNSELYLEIPENIRRIGESITGRSSACLSNDGLEMFLSAFNYSIREIPKPDMNI